MRFLLCGDRKWDDPLPIAWVVRALMNGPSPAVVIEGGAPGADSLAGRSADRQGAEHEQYPAKWEDYGRAAGAIRNQQMLDEGKPDVVFAFHDDLAASKGTADMVRRAKKAGIPVYLVSRP